MTRWSAITGPAAAAPRSPTARAPRLRRKTTSTGSYTTSGDATIEGQPCELIARLRPADDRATETRCQANQARVAIERLAQAETIESPAPERDRPESQRRNEAAPVKRLHQTTHPNIYRRFLARPQPAPRQPTGLCRGSNNQRHASLVVTASSLLQQRLELAARVRGGRDAGEGGGAGRARPLLVSVTRVARGLRPPGTVSCGS
jgi:hypothetical protein